ncbi:DNA helicase [Rhynchospora pubera]|uniref:DNA replication licensing factor MCM5 n=1 Tax=Rhynchospora pubera TaxID=906938 RepID=A0AAV8FNE5_9POAL|nr:DNA helicase [Rhynchospora pubera]
MSGWDEGAVYYSDQAQFPRGGDPDQNNSVTPHAALRKFKEFIRGFHGSKGDFPYRESLVHNPEYLTVALEDLDAFDSELSEKLCNSPAEYLPLFETAASEILASLRSKVAGETGEMEEPVTGDVQIFLSSKENCISMRLTGAEYMSKLVKIAGIVIAASRVKAKATYVTLVCKNCKSLKMVPCCAGLGGALVPRSCDHVPGVGEEPCPLDPWINPEDVPTGELPRNVLLSVDRHLVQTIVPGTRLTVMGIYSVYQASTTNQKGAVGVKQPSIRVVGLEQDRETNSSGPSTFTMDEEISLKEFAQKPSVYSDLCQLIAPSIYGHDDVKKAIACLLFGGSKKRLPDGVRLRGDIHVLLLGDPSTAKSQFLKFVEKTAPIAVYTSGKGSSAAGLTASVIRDSSSREFYLEGEAMVLADGGVVCIDEFDKMRPDDRVAIHEAMEQQTISIAKAGITTVLNSRTSVLAAANPVSGRYDNLKTAQDNIDLQTTFLSRFDQIFIVKDIRSAEQDKIIASHVIGVHTKSTGGTKNSAATEEQNWLKRYIEYCRSTCQPRLSEKAAEMLQNKYVEVRQVCSSFHSDLVHASHETGRVATIPITGRQLEAIIRLSESLARMRLAFVATQEHVEEAFRLFNVSTVDAARSGINEHLTSLLKLLMKLSKLRHK